MTEEFVEALVEAPVGVVTLVAIEERFGDRRTFIRPEDLVSDPEAVERAVDWVRGASVGEVLALAVEDGGGRAGPWVSGAAGEVAAAYRNAESRLPIAVAVAQRFDDVLHAPMDLAGAGRWVGHHVARLRLRDHAVAVGRVRPGSRRPSRRSRGVCRPQQRPRD